MLKLDNKEFIIKTYYIEDKHLLKNKVEMSHFCLRDVMSFFHSQNFNLQGKQLCTELRGIEFEK
jgi:hypothetical protein